MRWVKPKVLATVGGFVFALVIAGCGSSSAGQRAEHEFNRGLKYEVA